MRRTLLLGLAFLLLGAAGCSDYDPQTPDTKANRRAFRMMTGVAPDADITGIYAYADEFSGMDPLYCMAFTATADAVARVVRSLDMVPAESSFWHENFSVPSSVVWWDAEARQTSQLFVAENKAAKTRSYLWHHRQTGKCQFLMVGF